MCTYKESKGDAADFITTITICFVWKVRDEQVKEALYREGYTAQGYFWEDKQRTARYVDVAHENT